jgi:hypothetical protein
MPPTVMLGFGFGIDMLFGCGDGVYSEIDDLS